MTELLMPLLVGGLVVGAVMALWLAVGGGN